MNQDQKEPELEPVVVFLDLETTGLDPDRDVITEIAWIYVDPVDGDTVKKHLLVEYSGFPTRWSAHHTSAWPRGDRSPVALDSFFDELTYMSWKGRRDVFLAGAGIAFDDSFLQRVFREVPYAHSLIDVKAMAMGALGLKTPLHLRELRAALGIPGENRNPHNALSDALEAKLIYDTILARSR